MKSLVRSIHVIVFVFVAFALTLARWLAEPFKRYAEQNLILYANHKGSEGLVVVGTSAISELRGWEFDHQAETIEDTTLADADKTFKSGNKSWSGQATCWWDETDTNGQQVLDAGAEVGLVFYAEGTGTGATRFTGTALVTSVRRSAAINGIVEAAFSFQGNGALAEGTS